MSWLTDLGTYLQTAGYGTLGTSLHYYNLDSHAINDIALIPFHGPVYNKIVSPDVYNPRSSGLEVLVRNSSAETAFNSVNSIYDFLRIIANQTIGSTHFLNIEADASPGFVGEDKAGGFMFSVNFSLLIQ